MTDPDRTAFEADVPASPALPARRAMLRAAGLTALVGTAAAACSSDATSPAAPAASAAPSSATPSSAAPPSAAASPSADDSAKPSAGQTSKAADGPSVPTSEVPEGGGVILADADYVVTQPQKGEYKAFSKICTHQGCAVASVSDGAINCSCHGSKFSIEDGSVLNPPATKPLPEAKVSVSGGTVVISA